MPQNHTNISSTTTPKQNGVFCSSWSHKIFPFGILLVFGWCLYFLFLYEKVYMLGALNYAHWKFHQNFYEVKVDVIKGSGMIKSENWTGGKEKVTILMWTPYFGYWGDASLRMLGIHNDSYPECFVNCHFTYDRDLVNQSDGILFHAWKSDMRMSDMPSTKQRRPSHQLWVLLEQESPILMRPDLNSFAGLFNWTMTYRSDSDIFHPYGKVVPSANPDSVAKFNSEIETLISSKKKLIAGVISKCKTDSRRELLIDKMRKAHIPIDIYGNCGIPTCDHTTGHVGKHNTCTSEEFWRNFSLTYKFYLAFENSLCVDYVTEKLWRTLELGVVPLVYGGANYYRLAPSRSFISVAQFSSLEKLGSYLEHLDRNREEYKKYFEWKRHFKIAPGDGFCSLCNKLRRHKHLIRSGREGNIPSKVYNRLKEWWSMFPPPPPSQDKFDAGTSSACRHPSAEELARL